MIEPILSYASELWWVVQTTNSVPNEKDITIDVFSCNVTFKWINLIQSIFFDLGMSFIFDNQIGLCDMNNIRQVSCDQFVQKWLSYLLTNFILLPQTLGLKTTLVLVIGI